MPTEPSVSAVPSLSEGSKEASKEACTTTSSEVSMDGSKGDGTDRSHEIQGYLERIVSIVEAEGRGGKGDQRKAMRELLAATLTHAKSMRPHTKTATNISQKRSVHDPNVLHPELLAKLLERERQSRRRISERALGFYGVLPSQSPWRPTPTSRLPDEPSSPTLERRRNKPPPLPQPRPTPSTSTHTNTSTARPSRIPITDCTPADAAWAIWTQIGLTETLYEPASRNAVAAAEAHCRNILTERTMQHLLQVYSIGSAPPPTTGSYGPLSLPRSFREALLTGSTPLAREWYGEEHLVPRMARLPYTYRDDPAVASLLQSAPQHTYSQQQPVVEFSPIPEPRPRVPEPHPSAVEAMPAAPKEEGPLRPSPLQQQQPSVVVPPTGFVSRDEMEAILNSHLEAFAGRLAAANHGTTQPHSDPALANPNQPGALPGNGPPDVSESNTSVDDHFSIATGASVSQEVLPLGAATATLQFQPTHLFAVSALSEDPHGDTLEPTRGVADVLGGGAQHPPPSQLPASVSSSVSATEDGEEASPTARRLLEDESPATVSLGSQSAPLAYVSNYTDPNTKREWSTWKRSSPVRGSPVSKRPASPSHFQESIDLDSSVPMMNSLMSGADAPSPVPARRSIPATPEPPRSTGVVEGGQRAIVRGSSSRVAPAVPTTRPASASRTSSTLTTGRHLTPPTTRPNAVSASGDGRATSWLPPPSRGPSQSATPVRRPSPTPVTSSITPNRVGSTDMSQASFYTVASPAPSPKQSTPITPLARADNPKLIAPSSRVSTPVRVPDSRVPPMGPSTSPATPRVVSSRLQNANSQSGSVLKSNSQRGRSVL